MDIFLGMAMERKTPNVTSTIVASGSSEEEKSQGFIPYGTEFSILVQD